MRWAGCGGLRCRSGVPRRETRMDRWYKGCCGLSMMADDGVRVLVYGSLRHRVSLKQLDNDPLRG
jgi:hypothetical protein